MQLIKIVALSGNHLDVKAKRLMFASKAPTTWKKYRGEFKRFESWASTNNASALPADARTVIRYLAFRAEQKTSAALSKASAVISAFHKMEGFSSPCSDPRISTLIEGARRVFSKPVQQKAPLTTEMIRDLWSRETGPLATEGNLQQWKNCWLVTLMFRTCARFADVCKLKRRNFTFKKEGLEVFFQFR